MFLFARSLLHLPTQISVFLKGFTEIIVAHFIQLTIQCFNKESPERLQTMSSGTHCDAGLCMEGIASSSPGALRKKL